MYNLDVVFGKEIPMENILWTSLFSSLIMEVLLTHIVSKHLILGVLIFEACLSLFEGLHRVIGPPLTQDAILVILLPCK